MPATHTAPAARLFAPIDFKTRFPALDGVRALAILLVFADHFGGGAHGGRVLQMINIVRQRGWVGVDLFFVLSGFLITGILFDTRSDSHFFKRFFARRSLRIFPVFYLTAVVLLLLTPIFHYQWRAKQAFFLLYIGNFFGNADFSLYDVVSPTHPGAKIMIGHLWSLCVEEQFYLLWPLAVWLVRDRIKLLWAALGLSALALALRVVTVSLLSNQQAEGWIIRTLPFRMDALLLGGAMALLLRGPHADRWQRRAKGVFLVSLALLIGLMALSPAYDSPWLLTVGLTLIALASAGLIGTALRHGGPAYRVFHLAPMRVLGRYSYGFYIFHMLFGWAWIQFLIFAGSVLHSIALAGIAELSAAFLTTFLVSKLSYDLFESRFLRWKRRFEYDSEMRTHHHAFRA